MPSVLRDSHGFSALNRKFFGIIMNGNLETKSTFKSSRGTCILRGSFSFSSFFGALFFFFFFFFWEKHSTLLQKTNNYLHYLHYNYYSTDITITLLTGQYLHYLH